MVEREGYVSRHGAQVYWWALYPEGKARGFVAIVHGLGEHSGRHRRLAEFLAGRGYEVLLHDLRGHGKTQGGLRGHIDRFYDYTDDLRALIDIRNFRGPNFVIGHSLGGLIAVSHAQSYYCTLTGLVLCSPLLKPKLVLPPWRDWLARHLAGALPYTALSLGLRPESLSHDPEVVRAYRRDRLCSGSVTLQWYVEYLREMDEVNQRAPEITLPILILQAGEDQIVDPEGVRAFFERLRPEDRKLVVYEHAYHEVFNEPACQDEAYAEVAGWLDAHSPLAGE